jgi:uncharacterized protein (DUF1330 family)
VIDASEVDGLVDRLVSIHGEGGACPTAADWRAIFTAGGDRPLSIVNLLRFTNEVDTPDGPGSGAAAYRRYSSATAGAFARAGGEVLFFGPAVAHAFGLGEIDQWDATVVTRYPSAEALARMWLDPEFISAHNHRVDGIARSQVLVFGDGAPRGHRA